MKKPSSLINKIRQEFVKKDTIKLVDLYSTLCQDEDLEHLRSHLKHRIRGRLYNMKKRGKIELINEGTYKLINRS